MGKPGRSAGIVAMVVALCALAAFGTLAMPGHGDTASDASALETEDGGIAAGDHATPDGGGDAGQHGVRPQVGGEPRVGGARRGGELSQVGADPESNVSDAESGEAGEESAHDSRRPAERTAEEVAGPDDAEEGQRTLLEAPEFDVPVAGGEDGRGRASLPPTEPDVGGREGEAASRGAVQNGGSDRMESGDGGDGASSGGEGDDAAVDAGRRPIESPELP